MAGSKRHETLEFWRGRLPHWEVTDGSYFITIHLAGAIPKSAAQHIRSMSAQHTVTPMPRPVIQDKIFLEIERWLDHATPVNYLVIPQIADAIAEAIQYRVAIGLWSVVEYCIMPSHLHLLAHMETGRLKLTIESFKEHTGRRAMKILQIQERRFWQREWFDHWIRTPEEEAAVIDYIRQNPVKAGLTSSYIDWPYGSWNRKQ